MLFQLEVTWSNVKVVGDTSEKRPCTFHTVLVHRGLASPSGDNCPKAIQCKLRKEL